MKALTKLSLLLTLFLSAGVFAQPSLYVAGTHYDVLDKPVRTADPNKIEVTEVFWYGCPHCYAFEPLLNSWVSNLPTDVAFQRSPGMWNSLMEIHAQIYYVEQALGVYERMHSKVFDEIHQKHDYLQTEQEIKTFFVANGVDPAEFDKAWSSFAVTSGVKKANSRMSEYGIQSVPTLIVNGKYRITVGGAVRTHDDMLKVADYLIAMERKGLSKKS